MDIGGLWLLGVRGGLTRWFWVVFEAGARKLLQGRGFWRAGSKEVRARRKNGQRQVPMQVLRFAQNGKTKKTKMERQKREEWKDKKEKNGKVKKRRMERQKRKANAKAWTQKPGGWASLGFSFDVSRATGYMISSSPMGMPGGASRGLEGMNLAGSRKNSSMRLCRAAWWATSSVDMAVEAAVGSPAKRW